MKLYTDAARDTNVFGIGYVIILKSGARIEGKAFVTGSYTSMEAEYYALMEGLNICIDNITAYDDTIEAILDCRPLVQKITNPANLYDDKWYEFRSDALELFFEFEDWSVTWHQRATTEGNEDANRLAREALWQGRGDDAIEGGSARRGISYLD